jgi:hypothetical protein
MIPGDYEETDVGEQILIGEIDLRHSDQLESNASKNTSREEIRVNRSQLPRLTSAMIDRASHICTWADVHRLF